jgi:hypothetical protein
VKEPSLSIRKKKCVNVNRPIPENMPPPPPPPALRSMDYFADAHWGREILNRKGKRDKMRKKKKEIAMKICRTHPVYGKC